MLLISLNGARPLAPYERMLFDTGQSDRTLYPPRLVTSKTCWRTELASARRKVFTTANLKLLRQIAERVAIAVDGRTVDHRLKERTVDENPGAFRRRLKPSVDSEFGGIIGRGGDNTTMLGARDGGAERQCTVIY